MTLKRKVCAPEPCLWTIDGSGPTLGLRCWRCGRSAPWVTPPRSGIRWVQVIAWLVTVALALAALVMFGGCGGEPAGAPPATDSGPPMCAGYLVTSHCPGAPMVSGYPAIGCHDDAGKFVDGCLYNAGPAGRETTSLCVLVCPGF